MRVIAVFSSFWFPKVPVLLFNLLRYIRVNLNRCVVKSWSAVLTCSVGKQNTADTIKQYNVLYT